MPRLILFIALATMIYLLTGCIKPTRPVDPNIKRCAPWICSGQEWPGDYTNCTCRED